MKVDLGRSEIPFQLDYTISLFNHLLERYLAVGNLLSKLRVVMRLVPELYSNLLILLFDLFLTVSLLDQVDF